MKETNKWSVRDVITTVLLSAVLIVIQLVVNMVCMANDFVVAFADAAGGGHAVHLLHFNIEQQNVVDGAVFFHDARAVVEYGDGELLAGLALVAIEVIEYQLAACRVVLDDSDSDIAHDEPPRLTVQTTVHSLAE